MIDTIIRRLVWVYYIGAVLLSISIAIELSLFAHQATDGSFNASLVLETVSHTGILILLLGVAVFSFRPALKKLTEIHLALAQSERQLSRVLSTAVEGYAVIDPKTYKYTEVNQALCTMLGYAADEMIGRTPLEFCAPESHKVFRAQTSTIPDTDERQYQVVMLHKNGEKVFTQYNANTVRDQDGQPESAFAFITNITKIKQAQIDLKAAKESAEKATQLKDKFVSLIAHDLRNPIGAIRGYSELLQMDLSKNLTDDQKESLGYIHAQCDDLLALINDLLDLSRLQSGVVKLDLRFWDAHYVADNMVRRVEAQAKSKSIQIVNDIPKHTRMYGDQILIGQVLQNLITNAVKFSNEGSIVRLFSPDDQPHTIAVEDHGVGMDDAAINKLFSLENKQSTNGTAGETGSGFGLPLSAQIIDAHQGQIHVSSQPGQGSTFFVEIPEVRPTVLIVDDEADIRQMIKLMLVEVGVETLEAEDGLAAIKMIKDEGMPHLILTDIRMPNIDGIELIQKLNDMHGHDTCPIIALTAEKDPEVRGHALAAGASDFLLKPIQVDEFLPRVRHFIA